MRCHFRNKRRVIEAAARLKRVVSKEMKRSLTPVPMTTTFGTRDAAYQSMAKLNPLEAQV